MTNDFEHNEHEHGEEFVEHEVSPAEENARSGAFGNLTEAWRTRPMLKFMVLIVGVAAIGIAIFSLMGGNAHTDISRLSSMPNIKEPPGGAVSPYMRQQTEMANKERSDEAIASGGSALPTPIGQATDVGALGNSEKKDDALNELRAETERLKQQVQQQQVQQVQQQQQIQQRPPEQFDDTLAQAMQKQMSQLLESWTPKGIKQVTVVSQADLRAGDKGANATGAVNNTGTAAPGDNANGSGTAEQHKILVAAGTVSYAQLMTEANSDVPGPILAQIVSGPLSGARAVGSFKVSDGYEKYLVLEFGVADRKGKDYQISAIALDPDTTLGGMATEVDERYFVRVILPAAAGFLQGMGQALGQGSSSIETNGTSTFATNTGNGFKQGMYNGLGQAAQTAGQFFQNQANITKPLVRVASGTPMGLFFLSPVYDNDIAANPPVQNASAGSQASPYPTLPGSAFGGTGASAYPGTNVSGYGGMNGGNAANGSPYPNYGNPGYGYSNSAVAHIPNTIGTQGYSQGYSQGYGYGQQ